MSDHLTSDVSKDWLNNANLNTSVSTHDVGLVTRHCSKESFSLVLHFRGCSVYDLATHRETTFSSVSHLDNRTYFKHFYFVWFIKKNPMELFQNLIKQMFALKKRLLFICFPGKKLWRPTSVAFLGLGLHSSSQMLFTTWQFMIRNQLWFPCSFRHYWTTAEWPLSQCRKLNLYVFVYKASVGKLLSYLCNLLMQTSSGVQLRFTRWLSHEVPKVSTGEKSPLPLCSWEPSAQPSVS